MGDEDDKHFLITCAYESWIGININTPQTELLSLLGKLVTTSLLVVKPLIIAHRVCLRNGNDRMKE